MPKQLGRLTHFSIHSSTSGWCYN